MLMHDPRVQRWVYGIIHCEPEPSGDFLKHLAQVIVRADTENYAILREAIFLIMQRFSKVRMHLSEMGMKGPCNANRPVGILDVCCRLETLEESKMNVFNKLEESTKKTNKLLEEMEVRQKSERVRFVRSLPNYSRAMTIYTLKLTDEQRRELERIDKILFGMAEEVTEEETRTLKKVETEL